MRLIDIAASNLRVRRIKYLFLMLGVLLGTATMVSLYSMSQAMNSQLSSQAEQQGTVLLVSPPSRGFSLSYNGVPVVGGVSAASSPYLEWMHLETIRSLAPEGWVVAPKAVVRGRISSREVLLAGVDWREELALKSWWQISGERPVAPDDVLLGSASALELGFGAGSTLEISGRIAKVAGVIAETGTVEDRMVWAGMAFIKETATPPGVSFVEVRAPLSAGSPQEIQTKLAASLPDAEVNVVKGQQEARKELVERFDRFAGIISIVVLVIGCLIIATAMMNSVNERTSEIGIFRAIGFRRHHVMGIILSEAAIVGLLGGLAGYLVGMVAAASLTPLLANTPVSWNPILGLAAMLLSPLVTLLAGYYPAWRAARLDPVEALRYL